MKPLAGFRIVTLAVNLPGPAAARKLQSLGAAVTKVEPPGGDPMELYHARWYRDMAEGQTVVRLDLKAPEDMARLMALLSEADLLLSATRPAAMERLGLGWQALHQRYPRLCMVAITGFPAPRENEAGHDLTYQASLGLVNPPYMPRTLMADMAGAEQAASAALALLLARERCGDAGYEEVPLSGAADAMAEPLRYGMTNTGAMLGGALAEYNIYQTSDGWVAVAALEPHFKKRLEDSLKVASLEEYRTAFALQSSEYWQEWGVKMDLPIEAVRSM